MSTTAPRPALTIHLADYRPPAFFIDTVDLVFFFENDGCRVVSRLNLRRNGTLPKEPLRLLGEGLVTKEVRLNGQHSDYQCTANELIIESPPDAFLLETEVLISPDTNTALSGLYRAKDGYVTQCEAEGFRRITWFLDRPDVMSRYTVTIHADKTNFPVLLSNGNLLAKGEDETDASRHWAKWVDPFKKPSYLFALVAAKLDILEDCFKTESGRKIRLAIYVSPGKIDQCSHAMLALKKAMRWDEKRFGLECDLDQYLIVAVDDFNMGAMENKGLNIFNTKYVLAREDLATDTDFENIDRVVAHEYFHNWTGNRVTCRDWFQLSLKEGLTVYRDQEFGADEHDRSVARIRDVRILRSAQFPEDAGPMAHPVRPQSYVEINNFYTATVYEKGAEIIRMIATLIGKKTFREGMDEYFHRHDGEAVTCDDFVAAFAAVSGFDFQQFMRWYDEAGTPHIQASTKHDAAQKTFTLSLSQTNPKAKNDLPYLMPIRVALFDASGKLLPETEKTLIFKEKTQTFTFAPIEKPPVWSILRDFSAPVVFDNPPNTERLIQLLDCETDPFSAWEAGQSFFTEEILAAHTAIAAHETPRWHQKLIPTLKALLLQHEKRGTAFVAECFTLPAMATLAEQVPVFDPATLHQAREHLKKYLARELATHWQALYESLKKTATTPGQRALKNIALGFLSEFPSKAHDALLSQQLSANNMTDQLAALLCFANREDNDPIREAALAAFLARWKKEALVIDKYFAAQAMSRRTDTLENVRRLSTHPLFDAKNPNKIYALWRSFAANLLHFHAADGSGYDFIAEKILYLNDKNPQVAARLSRAFDRFRHLEPTRQNKAEATLMWLQSKTLSRDVAEIVNRALA